MVIHGIWFYDKQDCQRIAQRMRILTQQEQVLAQSQGGWLSPVAAREVAAGGEGRKVGNSEAKAVDIIQMLTKARTEYDKEKGTSEPKEIGGISALCGNPNLIKPIPVKPNTQDIEGAEPKALSLATLFGPRHQHHHHQSSNPVPPVAAPTSTGTVSRPPVARTLTYDDTVNSDRSVPTAGGHAALTGSLDDGVRPIAGEESRTDVIIQQTPNTENQEQANQPQHCPAIAKLMQGQKGVGGVLQTVSESPENRLCDNGMPLEHHHHHHHMYHHHHQQHHYHHHHQQQLQQLQPDPIKRLLQTHPPPPLATSFSSTASPFCSNPPALQENPQLSSKPTISDSASCSHLQAQQDQQLLFSLLKSQTEAQHKSQMASSALGTGLSSQMQGVVSPHELLTKLQLVQQEQGMSSHDPPRPYPGLAPRFLGSNKNQGASSSLGTLPSPTAATTGQKAALQFQVISPQRIPATVAPTLLLSPSVFTQTKASGGLSAVAQESCPPPSTLSRPSLQKEITVLSRSQLQATLLHLIQTDSSFLDSIYEAYISRFANSSSSKY
ncbi:mRNA-decapping enzyme 1B isoform X2 [Melanotaenia boesemani]|uniref:mRNA-decapping enzyme 1B isoform X2 n=1 Tax=Melanotaenia boesemani TaxID=1250792 RepID=UPI001C04A2E7|nr:mRNA-decapping enzyme 1B isoform X2 [Melanotaenia boesemani]